MGWWVAALAVGLASSAAAVELRGIETHATPAGADAVFVLSAPVRPTVRALTDTDGRPLRLYVDLPPGTRLSPAVPRALAASAPLGRIRIGTAEEGALRVALELDQVATYTVRRHGRIVTVAIRADAAVAEAAPSPPAAPAPPPAVAARPRGREKIVLDPGHGGSDPGAQGYAVEKEVTLAIARNVAGLLRERLGADVVLTRGHDTTLPLAARTARANAEGADLFVSIHANASPSRRLHGIETYYLNNTNDRGSIRLAAMENGLDLITHARRGADLRYILSDLVQVGKMEESIALATAVQRGLVAHLSTRYPGVADLGVKRGPFYVLVGAYMPCVLVETSFLTHPAEGRRLATAPYRVAVAEGIYQGIDRFLADARRARTL
jgi:N-acetylmuramoyl-L-alanine amidase